MFGLVISKEVLQVRQGDRNTYTRLVQIHVYNCTKYNTTTRKVVFAPLIQDLFKYMYTIAQI